jgi:hypothetical protein
MEVIHPAAIHGAGFRHPCRNDNGDIYRRIRRISDWIAWSPFPALCLTPAPSLILPWRCSATRRGMLWLSATVIAALLAPRNRYRL